MRLVAVAILPVGALSVNAAGFSGMGGAIAGMVASLGTGYIVSRFSYAPIFPIAGLMRPMWMVIIIKMLPNSRFRFHQPTIEMT